MPQPAYEIYSSSVTTVILIAGDSRRALAAAFIPAATPPMITRCLLSYAIIVTLYYKYVEADLSYQKSIKQNKKKQRKMKIHKNTLEVIRRVVGGASVVILVALRPLWQWWCILLQYQIFS